MGIDNPITAAKELIEADERQLPANAVIKLEKLLGLAFPPASPLSRMLENVVNKRKQENRDLLYQTTVDEVEKLLDRGIAFSDEHKRWVNDEFPGLLLEGLNRAEQTRSRQRVKRLAKVIKHAVEIGPREPAETADEMMRVAADLSDQDITTLFRIYEAQREFLKHRSGRPELNDTNSSWAQLQRQNQFFRSGGAIYSVCLKLQSFGLVMAMERIPTTLDLQSVPYALLPKGAQLIEYIEHIDDDSDPRHH